MSPAVYDAMRLSDGRSLMGVVVKGVLVLPHQRVPVERSRWIRVTP